MAESAECSICYVGYEDGDKTTLACGHSFHMYCLNETMLARGIAELRDLRCPECRMVGSDLVAAEEAQLTAGDCPVESQGPPAPATPQSATATTASLSPFEPGEDIVVAQAPPEPTPQSQPSQSQLFTPSGEPVPRFVDDVWGIVFDDASMAAVPAVLQDPIVDFKPQLEAVTNTSELMLLIYPKELFNGPSWDRNRVNESVL